MSRVAGRTNEHTQILSDAAYEMAQAGKSSAAIAERLTSAYDLGEVTVRQVNRWLSERFEARGTQDEAVANAFADVKYLRQRAYEAAEKCRTDLAFLAERNYWWSLHISALHIVLRMALNTGKAGQLPTQLEFPGIEEWYATIRGYRRVTPRLRGDPAAEMEEEEDLGAALDAFESEYGIIQLPTESM